MGQQCKICELYTKLLYVLPLVFLQQSHCCEYVRVIKVIGSSFSSETTERKIEHTQGSVLKKGL